MWEENTVCTTGSTDDTYLSLRGGREVCVRQEEVSGEALRSGTQLTIAARQAWDRQYDTALRSRQSSPPISNGRSSPRLEPE